MKHHDYKALERVMKHFDHSPKLRRLLWGILIVAGLYALRLPDLITALRG